MAEEKSEIQCFRSMEEANAYIRNYEIASDSKFVKNKSRNLNLSDLTTLQNHRLNFNLRVHLGHQSVLINDGIPTACIGAELRSCQYGHSRDKKRRLQEGDTAQMMDILKKRRKAVPSKKLGCPASIKLKKVLKFPDFFLEEEKMKSRNAMTKCLDKLRCSFNEETKRYILIYVYIDTNHNHVAKPDIQRHKHKSINHKIDEGCNRIPHDPIPAPERGPVLKRSASLKGKDLSDLAVQFKAANEFPALLARPKTYMKLEEMDAHQLMKLYHEITGQVPNDVFAAANKEFTTENLMLLLHLCILFANAAGDEQTHPSVRIKGMENDFTPVECLEADCALTHSHMHCPFCARTDSYTDVALLKAHYTKQHINKALEFSGLKILRCYDTCEVDGKSTDCKTFKGGHWHCYKCSNAIENRCDVLLHYKRHLNQYASSFQIHVAQEPTAKQNTNLREDLARMLQTKFGVIWASSFRGEDDLVKLLTTDDGRRKLEHWPVLIAHHEPKDVNPWSSFGTITHEIQNAVADICMDTSTARSSQQFSPSKYLSGRSPLKRQYADTGLGVHGTSDNSVVYVEEDELGNVLSTYTAQEIPTIGEERVISYADSPDVSQMKSKIRELEIQNKKLENDKILQKSFIEFLEKKNSDETEAHKLEKEQLLAEIELLKSRTVTEYANEPNISGEEENVNSYQHSESVAATVFPNLGQQKNAQNESEGPLIKQADSMDTVSDQLSSLKKEMEHLKSALHGNLSTGINFGANPAVRNTAPFYFVPMTNQRMVSPYQYIIPQNLTGLANTNPLNVCQNANTFQNKATCNTLSTDTQLKTRNSFTLPVTTGTSTKTICSSSANTGKPSTISSITDAMQTDQDFTESSDTSLDNTKISDAELLEAVSQLDTTDSSEAIADDTTVTVDSSEVTADASGSQDEDATDTSVGGTETLRTCSGDIETGNEPEISGTDDTSSAPAVAESIESRETNVAVISSNDSDISNSGVSASEIPLTSSTDVSSSNKDSLNDNEIFIATPLRNEEFTTSQNKKKDSLNSVNTETANITPQNSTVMSLSTETSKTSSSVGVNGQDMKTDGLNACNSSGGIINMPYVFQPTLGLQNTAPMTILPNQNFMNPFVLPQNLTGLINAAPQNVLQNAGVANSPVLSAPQNTLGSQNTIPFMLVQNQNGTFLVPTNKISGLDKVPGLNLSANTVSLNIKEQTSDTGLGNNESSKNTGTSNNDALKTGTVDAVRTKENVGVLDTKTPGKASVNVETPYKDFVDYGKSDSVVIKTYGVFDKGAIAKKANEKLTLIYTKPTPKRGLLNTKTSNNDSVNTRSPQKEAVNTRSSNTESANKKTVHVNMKSVNTRSSTKSSASIAEPKKGLFTTAVTKEPINTRSKSKESANTGTPVKGSITTRSSNIESVDTGAVDKWQISTKSLGTGATNNAGSITVHSVSSVSNNSGDKTSPDSGFTPDTQQSPRKKVVVLKVKGDVDQKTLSEFLQKNKIQL